MAQNIEDYSPVVQQAGLNTAKAVSFTSTLAVTGAITAAAALALTGAFTGSSTGTFSGILESESSVSSVQFRSGGATTFELGLSGETVSSVPIEVRDAGGLVVFGATNSIESEGFVSSTQFRSSGAVTFELGTSGETVSSVGINIAGIVGQDFTASSNPSVANATSTISGIGCIEMVSRYTGYLFNLTVTSTNLDTNGLNIQVAAGACPW